MSQQRYSPESWDEVVRQVTERGHSVQEVSAHLDVSSDSLYKWVEGLLPNPLPDYSIPVTDYLWGFSLWIVLAIGIIWAFYSTRDPREQGGDADDPSPLVD